MRREDLTFTYPEELVATEPRRPSRVLLFDGTPAEASVTDLLARFAPGDLLVVNQTKVLKRRVFAGDLEILFLREASPRRWETLFPSRGMKPGDQVALPEGLFMTLAEKGRPQVVEVSGDLDPSYFERWGEVPLPPYIQKARARRRTVREDERWYQTFWAEKPGSLAAPTASLHFEPAHFDALREKGVRILPLTLHVGLGTFLPVTSEILSEHRMHFETVEIPRATWSALEETRAAGRQVWSLGTTVARSLESQARGLLRETEEGFAGETDLFILPGHEWKAVDRLLTNFHQPESTLLALVAAFAGLENVKNAYRWAVERRFRLFSYGDLSAWIR